MKPEEIGAILSSNVLTRTLSAEDLEHLVAIARPVQHAEGSYVFRESQPRRSFGIIVSRRIAVQKGEPPHPHVLTVLGPGESYGEGSILDEYPHSTSAVVLEPARVIEFPRGA